MAPPRLAWLALLLCACQRVEEPVSRLPSSIRHHPDRPEPSSPARILWMAEHGQMEQALLAAEQAVRDRQLDHAVLEHMGSIFLRQGMRSKDSQDQLLTLIGASIASHEASREILQQACHSQHPLVQIHGLQGLASFADDDTDREMVLACGSPWLPIRLMAAQILAAKRSPHVLVQVEAMLSKLPWPVHPFLPSLLARVNTPESIHLCQKQLSSRHLAVRVAAVEALRQAGRDDCCELFREMATHDAGAQAEACAAALGALGDERAVPILESLLSAPEMGTRLAAAHALVALGQQDRLELIRAEAHTGNPYAIQLLGGRKEEIPLLKELLHQPSPSTRIHAMLGLLRQRDRSCMPMLRQLLRPGISMPALDPIKTPGRSLQAFGLRTATAEDGPQIASFKEQLLMQAIELPEPDFLDLAQQILEQRHGELVPLTVRLLENIHTPAALALLKNERQRAGAPLARIAAALALYRMGEPGPWEEQLLSWLREQAQHQLIQLKETTPWDPNNLHSTYELSPEQTSQVVIEALESLVQRRSAQAPLLVLEWLRSGHPRNRYVLAGILMRMAV